MVHKRKCTKCAHGGAMIKPNFHRTHLKGGMLGAMVPFVAKAVASTIIGHAAGKALKRITGGRMRRRRHHRR